MCHDGIDNDADGRVDYPDDPDCWTPRVNREERRARRVWGLGAELVLLLAPLLAWRRRRAR